MKICTSCRLSKPLSEFYKWKLGKGGRRAACKVCSNYVNKASIAKDSRASSKAKAKYKSRNTNLVYEATVKYRTDNPNKYKAHNSVNYAVRTGTLLKKVCEVCGSVESKAHHDDYLRPLDVRWLCQQHHSEWHSKYGEALNGN